MAKDYFPQGVASGDAFLGRREEIKALKHNISMAHHTLLIAPRRYGKTSLATDVLKKLKLPSVEVNFFLAVTNKAVERKVIKGVGELIEKITKKSDTLLRNIQNFFKTSGKKWVFSFHGVSLELIPESNNDPATNIHTALNLAEHLLAKKKQKAVIFFDEFQELKSLEEGRVIQGAIREFAQKSKYLVFIFSGSNRRLLKNMFDNSSMPLFELCERIQLERLDKIIYEKYLQKIAKKTWKKLLSEKVIEQIILLSQCHPRRIYNLCYLLWREHAAEQIPTSGSQVNAAWQKLLNQRLKDVRYSLHQILNAGQIKVLSLVASGATNELTGKIAQRLTNLSSPTLLKHLQALEDMDFLERRDEGGYRILDPVIDDVVRQFELVNLEPSNLD